MRFQHFLRCFAVPLLTIACIDVHAEQTGIVDPADVIMIQVAPGVLHFHNSPDHVDYPWLIGAEWQRASSWLAGYAYFNNSFGQKSHYLYGGKMWALGERISPWYLKLTGGLIKGYHEPYEDKIPLNHHGFAPAIIPSIGYYHERLNVQVNLLGTSGVMFTVGYDLFRR